jgi:hypothetical protein
VQARQILLFAAILPQNSKIYNQEIFLSKKLGLKPRPSRAVLHGTIQKSADFGEKPKKQIQGKSIGNTKH